MNGNPDFYMNGIWSFYDSCCAMSCDRNCANCASCVNCGGFHDGCRCCGDFLLPYIFSPVPNDLI
ncbi:MAG: hypothetical protein MR817_13050 [Lachnospiraceae bacterium]|nr:hypothetical protein [Lachnospiraceae bacterium]